MNDFWKQRLIVVVLLLVFLALGVGIGRSMAPTKVEKDTQWLHDVQEHEVYREASHVSLTWNVVTDAKIDRTKVIVERPDGTKVTTEHEASETHSESSGNKTEIKTVEVVKEVKVVDMMKVHELVEREKPQWRIGVQGGLDIPTLTNPGTSPNLFVIGGSVDRRILGPIFMGIWGNSKLQGGVGLSLEF